jgi:hypothetical protein
MDFSPLEYFQRASSDAPIPVLQYGPCGVGFCNRRCRFRRRCADIPDCLAVDCRTRPFCFDRLPGP